MTEPSASSGAGATAASPRLPVYSRGSGYGSRFLVSTDDLPKGWQCVKKSPKYTVWLDEEGKSYKSSREPFSCLVGRFVSAYICILVILCSKMYIHVV